MQFVMAVTNQNKVGRTALFDCLQPRQTASLHIRTQSR